MVLLTAAFIALGGLGGVAGATLGGVGAAVGEHHGEGHHHERMVPGQPPEH
jgi:hypothetical protein